MTVGVADGRPDARDAPIRTQWLLGTRVSITTYDDFARHCLALVREPGTHAADFSNTQVIAMRRHEQAFRAATDGIDYFLPDGMPVVWCLNLRGARMKDRVYGPTFMRLFMSAAHPGRTHYLLGGSDEAVARLKQNFPAADIVGAYTGRIGIHDPTNDEERANETRVVDDINRTNPDFIWVGLGTPKQHLWIKRNRARIHRGLLLGVGFAFDVNAGMKRDAPMWMQRMGLTWTFRMVSEPRRLIPRYLRYNSLFVGYLLCDWIRGRAFRPMPSCPAVQASAS